MAQSKRRRPNATRLLDIQQVPNSYLLTVQTKHLAIPHDQAEALLRQLDEVERVYVAPSGALHVKLRIAGNSIASIEGAKALVRQTLEVHIKS